MENNPENMNRSIQKSLFGMASIVLFFGIHSCSQKQKSENKPENKIEIDQDSRLTGFNFILDFASNKSNFKKDVYPMDDFSTEGGELAVFRSVDRPYRVFDFWLYGETGELNYTYWIDKTQQFLFARKTDIVYDKPYYEEGFKTDTLIRYLSFEKSVNKLFDKNGKEITSAEEMQITTTELESFFDDLTREIEIPK